jgi:acetyl esterase
MTPQEARASGPPPPSAEDRPDMHSVEEVTLAESSFRLRVLRPTESPDGIVVYYHGGGWVLFDIDHFDLLGRILARDTGAAVVLVDYRKAPEHPYPAAVEDSWTALSWVASNADRLAPGGGPLVVAGDSSGGNLAAVTARRARDRGGPRVDLQVLVYPSVDADTESATFLDPANQLLLTRDAVRWFWSHYVPDEDRRSESDAAPGSVADLSGLPPAVLVLAEYDVLRAGGEAYAARLRAAGVPVTSRIFDGQMHGFFEMVGALPASADAIAFVADAVRQLESPSDRPESPEPSSAPARR